VNGGAADRLRAFGRSLRPAHAWKNVPVGAALLFGHRASDPGAWPGVLGAFLAFCAVSSAGYLVNDVADREADRARPSRAARPVASGELPVRTALLGALGIHAATFLAAARWLPLGVLLALAAYVALTLLYTFALRRVPGLGPVAVAAGFVLRAWGGAPAAGVQASPWLLALTGVLSLALALAKREADARRVADPSTARRASWTDALLLLCAAGYLAWTQAPETVALHGTRALALTAVPVVLALARFRWRLRRDTTGQGPAELVARDPVVLLLGALWVALCAWVLYA
jgi:decaprenyl-phosphate phosphoribosyltransferase